MAAISRPTSVDGGCRGWLVVAASLVATALSLGVGYTFGVVVPSLVDQFDSGRAVVGGVGSAIFGFTWISGLLFCSVIAAAPVVSVVINRFGHRVATVSGALLAATGFAIATFAQNVPLLYFGLGLCGGVGMSFISVPAVVVVSLYFERRRSLATGIALCGSGVGTLALAPFVEYLLETYGWRGALLIEAGLLLNGCVCGVVFGPPATAAKYPAPVVGEKDENAANSGATSRASDSMQLTSQLSAEAVDDQQKDGTASTEEIEHLTEAQRDSDNNSGLTSRSTGRQLPTAASYSRYFDLPLLTDPALWIMAMSNLLTCVCYVAPYIYLPDLGQVQFGLSGGQTAVLVLIIGITDTVSRVLIGFAATLISSQWRLVAYAACLIVGGLTTAFAGLYDSFALLAVYSAVYGVCIGGFMSLLPAVLVDLFGVNRLTDAFGVAVFGQGIGAMGGTPIVGLLFDYRRNYNDAFLFAGLAMALGGVITFLLPCIKRRRHWPLSVEISQT